MKIKYLLLLILVILSLSFSFAFPSGFEQNKIYLKFKYSSQEYTNWIRSGKNFELESLNSILGENLCLPFISDATMTSLNKKLQKNKILLRDANSNSENIARICVVDYSNDILPEIAAKKISSFDFVEYAEPVPNKSVVGVPNDSLIYRQNYLNQIKIFDAWDTEISDSSIVIGIVDTGVDFTHEDLKDKMWVNPGESGKDDKGNDKQSNGMDDDKNGFIDDWHGWDFVSSISTKGDNDPSPGHTHGTHVAGIAAATTGNVRGIAGVSKGAKILAVKIGSDNNFSTSVINGYEGILYAATMGADIINCSWGSTSRSDAEMEVLSTAASLGSVIVSAAGNDGDNTSFFPASHKDAISVCAVDFNDVKAGFSNFHYTVDVASPGTDIYSSIAGNNYDFMDGTSMASPVAAGIAALIKAKYPEYNPVQVREHLKASSDNIDTLNEFLIGMMGRGRVNAFKAIQPEKYKAVVLADYLSKDDNGDNIFEKKENISVTISLENVLFKLDSAWIEARFNSIYHPVFINNNIFIGTMEPLETKNLPQAIIFTVPDDLPTDYSMTLEILIYDGNEYINSEYIKLIFNPSYRTMDANNIAITFNSTGNMAFNDYPGNYEGDGYRFKSGSNILYEGAFMLGIPPGKVSNVARGSDQLYQDENFNSFDSFKIFNPGKIAAEEGFSDFVSVDSDVTLTALVKQSVYQFDDRENENMILVVYDIINTDTSDYDSLYAALYFDWDIGPAGGNNIARFDDSEGLGYVKSLAIDSLPYAAVAMLSGHKLNYFAIDNNGNSGTNPGVWDGFSRNEKWMMMSKGIFRKESSVTDVSMVIGAGPIMLKSKDTTRVAFSIFSGGSLDEIRKICRQSRHTASEYKIADGVHNPLPKKDSIAKVYPNPADGDDIFVDFTLADGSYISIDIFNSIGQMVASPLTNRFITAGYQTEKFKLHGIAQGRYYIRISSKQTRMTAPFEFVH